MDDRKSWDANGTHYKPLGSCAFDIQTSEKIFRQKYGGIKYCSNGPSKDFITLGDNRMVLTRA